MSRKKRQSGLEKGGVNRLRGPSRGRIGMACARQGEKGDGDAGSLECGGEERALLDGDHPVGLAVNDQEGRIAGIKIGDRRGPQGQALDCGISWRASEECTPGKRPVEVWGALTPVQGAKGTDTLEPWI